MLCSQPPPLTDDQITAALDGVAGLEVVRHLEQCASCAARFQQARRIEQVLAGRLNRWDCPGAQELGDYHLHLLPPERRREIETHLNRCARCQEELADLRAFLELPDVSSAPERSAVRRPQPPERPRLGELVARLLPRTLTLAPAMRGAEGGPIMAEADGVTIFLEALPTSRGVALSGQIVGAETWTGALVEVWQEGALVLTALVNDLGGFRGEPFQIRPTDLRIASPTGQVITLYGVEFG